MESSKMAELINKQPDVRAFFRGAHIVICRYVADVSQDVFNFSVNGVIPEYVKVYIRMLYKIKP